MSQPFKPLVANGPSSTVPATAFRLKVVSPAPPQPGFTPVVVAHDHAHAPGADGSIAPAPVEPVVTLQREGDRVTGIQIKCGCGQTIEFNCVY